MRTLRNLLPLLLILHFYTARSQVFLSEGFESGSRPTGWTEEYVTPPVHTEPWRYRNGGHSPNDNNWLKSPSADDPTRNPPSAYEGTYNAIFFKQGDGNERTKLITPPLDLEGGTRVELSFYLAQIPWTFEGSTGWDVLRVYYKVSEGAPWVLLHEYLDPVYDWELQTLVLPNLSSTYYIAFEGHTRWGYGTCIDNVVVEEKGITPFWIGDMQFNQPFTPIVPSGSTNVPVMRIDLKVFGNTGAAVLDHINFTSLNTADSDIVPGSVKLYSTVSQSFNTSNQLGSNSSFISGIAAFPDLNYNLPHGQSYLWLAVDIAPEAVHGNIVDVMVAANDIMANDTLYPAVDQSPPGRRIIYEAIYFEDFEGTHNWQLTGEFEVATPNGMGGSPGNPNPSFAYSGSRILGTDLTGLGAHPYNYEPNLTHETAYRATSPVIDATYYKNLRLFFQRHLNIEVWDDASIKVSSDNGVTWSAVWENSGYISDFEWIQIDYPIFDNFSRTRDLKIRFKLGPTDGQNNYSGWNVDNIALTGEFISRDVGVSEWIYPQSGCGHTDSEQVVVRIKNYGGAEITDPIPVAYSFDGGVTWTADICNENIPVDGSVVFTFPTTVDLSEPGHRPKVLTRTMLQGDQFAGNNQIQTQLILTPTNTAPHHEDFEENDGFWNTTDGSIWEHGTPQGEVINSAYSGSKSWVTGLSEQYGDLISETGQVIFQDNFENVKGWTLTGEFERAIPMDLPYWAYSGLYCIGTDLSGQGDLPYMYEKGIDPSTAYSAISPPIDVTDYSNLKVSFMRWLSINEGDSVSLAVSPDNGSSWYTVWKNTEGEIRDEDDIGWVEMEYSIHDSLAYSTQLRIKFSLFYSAAGGDPAHGFNIDDFYLKGDFVSTPAFSLTSPCFDLSDLSNPVFEAKIWVDTEEGVDGATLYYSVDEGLSWTQVSNSSGFDEYWNWYTGRPVAASGTDGWSGQTDGWVRVRHLLPGPVAGIERAKFRITFKTDKYNNNFDGIAIDDIKIYDAPFDAGVVSILSPESSCELAEDQTFILRIKNYGVRDMQPGDTIKIGYQVDRDGELQTAEEIYILTGPLTAGTTKDISFNSEFDFNTGGEYHVDVYTIEDDPFFYSDTANDLFSGIIVVEKPVFSLGPDIYTVRPDTVILNAYAGEEGLDYLWQDNSTGVEYHVSTEGTYHVKVTNDIGCFSTDTITVHRLIADVGVTELISPVSSCELETEVPLTISIKNFGTDTLNIKDPILISGILDGSYHFNDQLIVSQNFYPGTEIEFTLTEEFDFSSTGTYHLKIYTTLAYDDNADNDTLELELIVYGYPDIDLGPDLEIDALEYEIDAGPGFSEYLWQDGSEEQTFLADQPGKGKYYVQVTNDYGCSAADTVYITLNILDIALDEILSPGASCLEAEGLTVSVRIINKGNLAILSGEEIDIWYTVDEGTPVEETIILTEDLLYNDTVEYTFSETALVEDGEWYDFAIFINYPGDMNPVNNEISTHVGIYATPFVDLGPDYQEVTALEHILDAGDGFVSYLWQDTSTEQTYTVNTPGLGTYSVTVTDLNGCTAFAETDVLLLVTDIGVTDIVHPVTDCMTYEKQSIEAAIENLGNMDISPSSDIKVAFSVNGSEPLIEEVILNDTFKPGDIIFHTSASVFDLSMPGDYSITAYTIFDSDLVLPNDSKTVDIEILSSPEVDIGVGQDTIVVLEATTLTATPGYASYLWQDGSTENTFTVNTAGPGLYHVVVTSEDGCQTADSILVIFDVPDLGLNRVVSPVSSCEHGSEEVISVEIVNNGYYRIAESDNITLSYSVNGGTPVTEVKTFDSNLYPGEMGILEFDERFDFSTLGNYDMVVSFDFAGDQDPANDELSLTINTWGYPDVDISGGQDTLVVTAEAILFAASGYNSYVWQDGNTGNMYFIDDPGVEGLYHVTVTDINGCYTADSVYVIYDVPDLELNRLVSPVSSCELGNAETVSIEVVNNGLYRLDSSETVTIYYSVFGSVPVTEEKSLGRTLHPGETVIFDFDRKYNFSTFSNYEIKVGVEFEADQVPSNDELNSVIDIWGYPDIDIGEGRDSIIVSEDITLSVVPGYASYLWQDGSTGNTFTIDEPGSEALYHVQVTNAYGCTSYDTVYVLYDIPDLGVNQLVSPVSSCELGDGETVSVNVVNNGLAPLDGSETLTIYYSVNDGTPVSEVKTLGRTLYPGEVLTLEFDTRYDFSSFGTYDILVGIDFESDQDPSNDELTVGVEIWGYPDIDIGEGRDSIVVREPLILSFPDDYDAYLWQDGSTGSSFTVDDPGVGDLYHVRVSDVNGCSASDTVYVLHDIPDLEPHRLLSPVSSCELNDDETISFEIVNNGLHRLENSEILTIYYSVNDGIPVSEVKTLGIALDPGESLTFEFETRHDFSSFGRYDILVGVDFEADQNPSNDELTAEINAWGYPVFDLGDGKDTIVIREPFVLAAPAGYDSYLWQDGSTGSSITIDDPGMGAFYNVRVTDHNGCSSFDSLYVLHDIPDLELTRLVLPESSCELDNSETISVKIANHGLFRLESSESITIYYSVNGGDPVAEMKNLDRTFKPGEHLTLVFDTSYDFSSVGIYEILAGVDFPPDQNPANNELSVEISTWGYPVVDIGNGQDTIIATLPIDLDAGEGYHSYSWQDNSTASTYTVTEDGLYWVIVTNEFGCSTTDSVYVEAPLGIWDPDMMPVQISIYPNPAEDILFVVIENEVSSDYRLELFSVDNKLVYNNLIKNATSAEEVIHVKKFPAGTYLLRIFVDNKPVTFKVIII